MPVRSKYSCVDQRVCQGRSRGPDSEYTIEARPGNDGQDGQHESWNRKAGAVRKQSESRAAQLIRRELSAEDATTRCHLIAQTLLTQAVRRASNENKISYR